MMVVVRRVSTPEMQCAEHVSWLWCRGASLGSSSWTECVDHALQLDESDAVAIVLRYEDMEGPAYRYFRYVIEPAPAPTTL